MFQKTSSKEIFIVLATCGLLFLFFYGLGSAFFPLTLSWFLAYATMPLVQRIEEKGYTRLQTSSLVLSLVLFVVVLLILLIIPPVLTDFQSAISDVPQNVTIALGKLDDFLSAYDIHIHYDRESLIDYAKRYSQKISTSMISSLGDILKNSVINAASVIMVLLNLFLIPIFFIYVINDYENLIEAFESLVPLSWRPTLDMLVKEANNILSGYIRGQLLVCTILGVLYSLGLLLVGVKFALLIGFMTGILSIIPYVGFSFGLAAALITALANFEGFTPLIGIIVVYTLVQILEGFVITPRIVGNKVGLSPLEAILALIIMGNLFGFIGLFIAIPLGAISKMAFLHLLNAYKKTAIYRS